MTHHAHLFYHRGKLTWSGSGASGDPVHRPWAFVVDIGRDFMVLRDEGLLYLNSPGPQHFATFTPEALVTAAKSGLFGLRLVETAEAKAISGDKERVRRRRLGRQVRVHEDLTKEGKERSAI